MMVNSIYFETSNLNGTVVKQVLFLNGVYKTLIPQHYNLTL